MPRNSRQDGCDKNKYENSIQAVGLDIGTNRVRCVIGEPDENDHKMNIVGIGQAEPRGLRAAS